MRLAFRHGPDGADAALSLLVVGDVAFEEVLAAVGPAVAGAGVEPRLLVFSEAGFRTRSRDGLVAAALADRGRFLVGDEATLTRLLGR